MSFYELHLFLQQLLGLDPSIVASFYIADREWEPRGEITLIDTDENSLVPRIHMKSVKLSDYIYSDEARFIYAYNLLQDKSLLLEVLVLLDGCVCEDAPICLGGEGEFSMEVEDILKISNSDIEQIIKQLHEDGLGDECLPQDD